VRGILKDEKGGRRRSLKRDRREMGWDGIILGSFKKKKRGGRRGFPSYRGKLAPDYKEEGIEEGFVKEKPVL